MKRFISLLMAILLCAAMLASCGEKTADTAATDVSDNAEQEKNDGVPVRVLTLMGPTGMGMAKLINDAKNGDAGQNYKFTVASSPDEFTGDIIQGNFEFAAVPTNLAATLYAKTKGAVSAVAVNTKGVLYVLENGNTLKSIEDLQGKTVYLSGQAGVPEYALKYILDAFGIKCELVFESEHDAVISDILSNKASIAVLPEPKVTSVMKNKASPENLRIAFDLNDLWNEACEKNSDTASLYMGCVIVNNKWAGEHPDSLSAFLEEYKQSVDFVNTDENAPQMIVDAGIIPAAPIAKAALVNSHIVCITGDEMYLNLKGFYQVLFDFNPKSIGGKMPDDTFYNTKNSYVIVD